MPIVPVEEMRSQQKRSAPLGSNTIDAFLEFIIGLENLFESECKLR
jgi:hypothetical protein